ncbi:hypothetical protein ACH5RR_021430, partial [Cinchona calisaya]
AKPNSQGDEPAKQPQNFGNSSGVSTAEKEDIPSYSLLKTAIEDLLTSNPNLTSQDGDDQVADSSSVCEVVFRSQVLALHDDYNPYSDQDLTRNNEVARLKAPVAPESALTTQIQLRFLD